MVGGWEVGGGGGRREKKRKGGGGRREEKVNMHGVPGGERAHRVRSWDD